MWRRASQRRPVINTRSKRYRMPLVALASLILALAYGCSGAPGPETDGTTSAPVSSTPAATNRPTESAIAEVPAAPTAADPVGPAAEPSTSGDLCGIGSEEIDGALIADLGFEDGTQVAPNASYRETWRLRNTGGCTWPEGTALVFVSGDPIPGPQWAPVSQVGPGRDVDITIELRAPAQPARYASYWRLQAPGGQLFGAVVYSEIVVSSDAVAPVSIPEVGPRPSPTRWPTAPPVTYSVPLLPTPQGTETPAVTGLPTPDTPSSDSPCSAPDTRFGPAVRQAEALGISLPCLPASDTPAGAVVTEQGTFQVFWQEIDGSDPAVRLRSLVIVREATRTVYVLKGKDAATYQAEARAYDDTWSAEMPEQPEACAPLVPPPGHTMPSRRIGWLWCDQSLWNSVGWPQDEAETVTLVAQGERNQLLLQIISQTAGTYLVAIDLDARAATVYQAR